MKTELMTWINTMLYGGCICGLILYVCPSGKIKDLLETGVVCVMLLSFLSPLAIALGSEPGDMLESFLEEQRFRELQMQFSASDLQNILIAEEYKAYICSEAAEQGIALVSVEVITKNDENGYPLPVEVRYYTSEEIPNQLKERIAAQLGVAVERQCTYESAEADG